AITPLPDLSYWPADRDLEEAEDHLTKSLNLKEVDVWLPFQHTEFHEREDDETEEMVPQPIRKRKKSIFDHFDDFDVDEN
ncbi:hypothetical protein, partial [Brevibacillus massiliensis]|uniref:hypothetical protein n=1 Tax=Brevibacillus massiliensis TaxID=1118054 RepID=UPI00054F2BF5